MRRLFANRRSGYKTPKKLDLDWKSFDGGLNTLLRENEIRPNELSQTENIMLKGKGAPTKRYGTVLYHTAGATGSVRGLKGFYISGSSTNELLAISDNGLLTIRNGSSYTERTGVSWASGYPVYMAQLDNRMYIVNGQRELARYSSPTLVGFPTINAPAINGASNLSNATGPTVKSYRVSSVSRVGETLASTPFELRSQPNTLGGDAGGTVLLYLTPPSFASGDLVAFNVYGRNSGDERFLGAIPGNATIFVDDGTAVPKEFTFPPTSDSTGGPVAKYVVRFQDRLMFAGLNGEPTKMLVSGRAPNHEKFDLAFGGNFIKIEPDAGDDIVQIIPFADRVISFKENSIWEVKLGTQQVGNFFVTLPEAKLITASNGCIAPRSVVAVENDVFFLSRTGVRTLGYEEGFAIDVLRSNEVSVKVRPYFESLSIDQLMNATATYYDNKYIIAFPGLNECMVFDRERLAWIGPWTFDANTFEIYYDTDDNQKLIFGSDTAPEVVEVAKNTITDRGVAVPSRLRTKIEDFGDWSIFKEMKNLFLQFRNVQGEATVDVKLEKRSGTVITSESLDIAPNTGNTGWGADMWADAEFGDTNATAGGTDPNELVRWAIINDVGRNLQLTLKTDNANDNYELLNIRADARPISSGLRPTSWRVAAIPLGLFMQSMPSNMAGVAPSDQIFQYIISWIQVNMMNMEIVGAAAFLTLLMIAIKYLVFKKPIKSTSILSHRLGSSMFISGIKFTNSFLRKFHSRFHRHLMRIKSIFYCLCNTFFRTKFSPSFSNSTWNFKKLLFTHKTMSFLSTSVKTPTIQGSTFKRAAFFSFDIRSSLKRFFAISTFSKNIFRKSSSLPIAITRTKLPTMIGSFFSKFFITNNTNTHRYRNYTIDTI